MVSHFHEYRTERDGQTDRQTDRLTKLLLSTSWIHSHKMQLWGGSAVNESLYAENWVIKSPNSNWGWPPGRLMWMSHWAQEWMNIIGEWQLVETIYSFVGLATNVSANVQQNDEWLEERLETTNRKHRHNRVIRLLRLAGVYNAVFW